MKITHASSLTDSQLTTEVVRLARGEREATVALIVHLAEFDARRLFEGEGLPSTFNYCVEVLRLSEDAAFNRIEAARAARRFPVMVEMLTAGTLSPTTARMLARRLTGENHDAVLAAAGGKSKREVEKLLARLFPQADVACSVRKLRSARPMPAPIPDNRDTAAARVPSPVDVHGDPSSVGDLPTAALPALAVTASAAAPISAPSNPRPVVRPLAPERYEIRFTASAETCEKLRRAQDLLGHALPSGDLAQVFDRALTLLVQDLQRTKFAATERPRASRGQSEDSRNIPAAVQRAVATRDGGRCAFVAPNGRRCGERRFLEFHHVVPYGAGGKPTVDNIQLRCRAHNRYEADVFYGPARRYGSGVPEDFTRSGTGHTDRPKPRPALGSGGPDR